MEFKETVDPQDRLLQGIFPTVMVPIYSPLPELNTGERRFLMAKDGLWLEAKPFWGKLRRQLWESPVELPYGEVKDLDHLTFGPIPPALISVCKKEALEEALKKKEWACWIVVDGSGNYSIRRLEANTSYTAVHYERAELNERESLILDAHSHPFDMPVFSHTDDLDDMGGIHYSGVISFDKNMKPKLTVRLCVEGLFFE